MEFTPLSGPEFGLGSIPFASDEYRQHLIEVFARTTNLHTQRVTEQMRELARTLPSLTEEDLLDIGQRDGSCPICMTPFLALLSDKELALAMEGDSAAYAPAEQLGVTKLVDTCGHLFCRKDISTWINDAHDSCPMCRQPLLLPATTPSSSSESTPQEHTDSASPPLSTPNASASSERNRPLETAQELLERLFFQGNMSVFDPGSTATDEEPYESPDRSEFSGMYS